MSTIVLEHLQHANSASPDLTVDSSGRIGIGTSTPSSKLTVSGSQTIANNEAYWAANLTEASDYRVGLRITPTRDGQTKGLSLGAIGAVSGTGIQAYDTSDDSANPLLLNPFGGSVGVSKTNPGSHLHVGNIDNTIKTAYFDPPTSGDIDVVTISRGWGSHKGSGLHISGANYTNGTNTDAAMIQLNAATYGGENTRYMHMYDSGGTDFIFRGDGTFLAPNQPMFAARLSTNWTHGSGVRAIEGTWSTIHNVGNHWDNTTRRFTAPVTGTYLFSAIVGTVGGTTGVSYISAEVWVNGSRANHMTGGWDSGGSSYNKDSNTFITQLNAGDYVTLASEINITCTIQSGSHTQLRGILLG